MDTYTMVVPLYHLVIVAIFICTNALHYVYPTKLFGNNFSENFDKSGLRSGTMVQWAKSLPHKHEYCSSNP